MPETGLSLDFFWDAPGYFIGYSFWISGDYSRSSLSKLCSNFDLADAWFDSLVEIASWNFY